ncbi:hypothetical protein GF337_15505 [candidate division KSB1 bacterium]|nr:hypothetical protein [candidate division KSB1 bacterium]
MIDTKHKSQRGGIYVITLFIMIALLILGLSLIQLTAVNRKTIDNYMNQTKADYVAEAGIERAVVEYVLKDKDRNLSEYSSELIFLKAKLGEGYYNVFLINGTNSSVNIQSKGFCRGKIKNVNVHVAVNWEADSPHITSFRYQTPVPDSLLMVQ